MLTDLLTSSKGPGVIGTLLALVVLVGFGSLMLLVNDTSAGSGLGGQIREKEAGVISAESRIKKWEATAVEYSQNRKQKDELESLQRSLGRKQTEVTQAAAGVEEAKGGLAEVVQNFEEYKQKYRIAERARAIGETMETLNTKDGDVYEQVKVLAVTPIGMKIMHKRGNTRVEYTRLPDEIQDRFQFTKEGAAQIAQQEAAQVSVSKQRAKGYYKAVAIRDLRTKINQEKSNISRATRIIGELTANISNNEANIVTSQRKADTYRARYASGSRGLTLDIAKKAERRVDLLQKRVRSAKSQINSLNKTVTMAKRNIAKLEAEINKKKKAE